jgi:lambda family phage tail tape measure protein
MDLAELKFVVDTTQLKQAAKEVEALGVAVSKVNKPVTKAAMDTEKLAKAQAEVAEKTAKAALAQHKLEQAQTKSNDSTGKSISVLERQTLITRYMAEGNSKGQASLLATAKAAGALDEEMEKLEKTLKTQRSLIGGDPFDKSIGLMQKLSNETKIVNEVNNLFNRGLNLTEKQMVDLAREHERLIALYNFEGKSLDGLAAEYDQIVQKSVQINQANDARTNSMKAQVKTQNDAAKANEYIAKEMERVNRLTASNGDLTSATNNKLIKFEQSLKASGRSAAEVTTKLNAYKAALMATQKAAGNRQIDYLSRALGPQITDIAVGLATGQAPLTILLQQGGQLRDQFALAGVAGSQMGSMLIQASKAMVSSVKDVGLAVGQVFVGAITGSGKAVVDFATKITGANILLDAFRAKIIATAGENSIAIKAFDMLGKGIVAMAGVITFTAIASLVAFGVAMSDIIKEENALNRALNLTGAAMGISMGVAYDAAKGMEQLGVSTGTALTVLTEMAKAGGMSADSLEMVATTAKAMKTAFDIPIADTVKQFKELQEKPTESLTKLAIKLGTIPLEILKQVDAYERAGKSIEAAKLATDTYAKAGKDAADRTVENFGTITRFGIYLKSIWDKTWDSIMGIGRTGSVADQLLEAESELENRIMAQAKLAGGPFNRKLVDSDTEKLKEKISKLREQLSAEQKLQSDRKAASADATKFEDDKKKRDEAAAKANAAAKKLEEDRENLIRQVTEAYISQTGALDHLSKNEILRDKIMSSKEYQNQSKPIQEYVLGILNATIASEKLVEAEKEAEKALELKNRLLGKSENLGKDYYKTIDLINKYAKEGRFGADEVLQLKAALEATTPEAKRLAAAQAENAKVMAGIAADRANVAAEYGGDFKTADEKAAIKNLSDYKKKISEADAELDKQLSAATEETTYSEYMMYKELADARKSLAEDVHTREQYLLSDGYKRQQAYATAFEDLFKGMGDAIIDFALTGKTSFSDMVQSMIVGLIKLEMQMAMTNMYKSAGGSAGIISSIASMFTGSPVPSAKGNVFDGGLQAFAKGGAFTNSVVKSPTMFNMGLMGEAGPEAIMPLRRGSDGSLGIAASGGSGGNVSVQVINNSNAQATTNETVDSKGNRKIEVLIGDMTAGEISRSGSASQKSIRSTFGVQPQLIRR